MKNIVTIDARFQKSVNLALDLGDMDRVNHYIPTRSSVAILKRYLENIANKQGEHATILIGPYGKGKSHLLLVLLALLCKKEKQETNDIAQKILQTDPQIEPLLTKKVFFPVIISSFQENLNQSFIFALQEALKRAGLENLSPKSEFGEALHVIEYWKEQYTDTYSEFETYLQKEQQSVEKYCELLKRQDKEALDYFKMIYPHLTSGSVFMPMVQKDALCVYKEINRVLCDEYGYAGIYIIFDEFSKYVEGHGTEGFAVDMKILQDMCELANNTKEEELYITFVAHKSLHEYVKGIPTEMVQAFRGVEGRLQEIRFVVSAQNNYELIENVLKKKNGFYTQGIQELTEKSYELPCFTNLFQKEDFRQIVAEGCYPLMPVCAYALLHISEKVGQNERTVFTFLAGNEAGSLLRIMEKRKPDELIGVDCVYDYFKNLFRETVDEPYIHKEWLKADYALTKADTEAERKVLKAIAVIRMVRRTEELPVTEKTIGYALGIDSADYQSAIRALQERQVIQFRKNQGMFDFKNNIGIDVEAAITKEMNRLRSSFRVCAMLNEVSELTYAIPKQYNQNRVMTRYFRYQFLTVSDYMAIEKSKVFFEACFCDGYILTLMPDDKISKQEVEEHLKELGDERLIVILPKENVPVQEEVLHLAAIRSLAQNQLFIEDNQVLCKELDLYEEDVRYGINEQLRKYYMPENKDCYVIHSKESEPQIRTGMEFNRYLSRICEDYYSLTPKINHELLNIQNVQGQYLRARNIVVKAILEKADLSGFEQGSSPEAMVYRAAFLRTGLNSQQFPLDTGCRKIIVEIEKFFAQSVGQKKQFRILYERLQGKDYGVRKGIMPLFLAWTFGMFEGMPVIYLGKKELDITVEVLNNINEFPKSYALYIEKEDMEKETYLKALETVFCEEKTEYVQQANRLSMIRDGMQKWYRSLPQYSKVSEHYPKPLLPQITELRRLLKRTEINARELLFEQLPEIFQNVGYAQLAKLIKKVKKAMDSHLENEIADIAGEIKIIFCGEKNDSLKACLNDWSYRQRGYDVGYVPGKKEKIFADYLQKLDTNDEQEIVSVLSKRVEDVYVEDWNDATRQQFLEDLRQIRQSIEMAKESSDQQGKQQEIFLKTADGAEIHKFYEADTKDSTSEFLKNMIEEALDNFGESLETNQKVAVLAETLEKLLQ